MMRVDGRRFVRSLYVGGLLFLLAGGGMGFAMAATQGSGPEELVVPAPKPGDRAIYSVERDIIDESIALGGPGDIRLDEVVYEWLPERWVVDATFGDRLARPLHAEYGFMMGTDNEVVYDRTVLYDAVDGHVLMQHFDGASRMLSGPYVGWDENAVLPPMDVVGGWTDVNYEADEYRYTRTPCGVLTPLQGAVYDGAKVVLPGRCAWEDGENQMRFQGDGWEGTGDERAYRFTAVSDPRIRLWFDNEAPFPTRLTSSAAEIVDPDWTLGRLFELTLRSWAAGSGTYTPMDPSVLPAPDGPVPQAPLTPWTLDDTGMEAHGPLSLSAAYEAAMAASNPVQVVSGQPNARDWLAAHPDAYLAAAWTLEYHDESGNTMPQWLLLWVDGSSWLGKVVSWEAARGGNVLPEQAGRHAEVSDWQPSWLAADITGMFPEASRLPSTLPRPADLARQYHRLFGEDAQLNRYGFQIFCKTATCGELQILVEVGLHSAPAEARNDPTIDRLAIVDKLMVYADGTAAYRHRYLEATPAVVPLAAAPPPGDRGAAVALPAPAWVLPAAPAAAAGIGLVAVVGAALYYFWPALKGAALAPLFSRIEDDEVLKHPNRARINDLIRAEPGIHFQDLSRRVGLGRGTLDHHLRKLVDAGLVTIRRSGGYACCFPKGSGAIDRRLMDAAPVLRSQGGRAVLQVVARRPGTSSRDLAIELGLAPSTVSYHLKKLELAGLVLPDPAAGVRLTPLGEQAKAAAA